MNDDQVEILTKLAGYLEQTSIWRPCSVEQEPETILTQWRVFKVAGDFGGVPETIHFVGNVGYEGRVCSPVETYDPVNRRGITRSGRVYELKGDAGYNRDAMHVWARWLNMSGSPTAVDITEEYERG